MIQKKQKQNHFHGPENAEHEIRKAYKAVIDTNVVLVGSQKPMSGPNVQEVNHFYKHAYQRYRDGNRLSAERWARATKHLSRAFCHEAKIAYLEPRASDLPFLAGATEEEYGLYERADTTADLLESVATHIPPGLDSMPNDMRRYLVRARKHLEVLQDPDYRHELLRAERIRAAHEYGRVLECMALAYESESPQKSVA